MPPLELSDEEAAALLKELDGIIEGDRYPLSPRMRLLKEVRAKIKPYPAQPPLPPIKHHDSPRASVSQRRRAGEIRAGAADDARRRG